MIAINPDRANKPERFQNNIREIRIISGRSGFPFYYLLEGHTPIQCENPIKWAAEFEKMKCRVAKSYWYGVLISTVFLGIDHSFGQSAPQLFETMIFGGIHHRKIKRYSTWDEAVEGHYEIIKKILGVKKMPKYLQVIVFIAGLPAFITGLLCGLIYWSYKFGWLLITTVCRDWTKK